MAIDNIREIRPRARYAGEEVYFDDLEEFGVEGIRSILIACGVPARRAALDAFWLLDQRSLDRHVTSGQSSENRSRLVALRARFESEAVEYRNRLIPR